MFLIWQEAPLKSSRKNNGAYFLIAASVLASAGSLLVLDSAISSAMTDYRTISLSQQAESEMFYIDAELNTLRKTQARLAAENDELLKKSFPTLDDLKALKAAHRLLLVRMERLKSQPDESSGPALYRATYSGTVGSVSRFLRQLEEEYTAKSPGFTLTAASEDGNRVVLTLTLATETR